MLLSGQKGRIVISVLLVVSTTIGRAQITGHDSLTEDFAKATPKERAKIAKREAKESQKDQEYQKVMKQAENAFQEERYEDALTLFEQAREMRPYNVYPKVKIEDLYALLGITEEEAEEPVLKKQEDGLQQEETTAEVLVNEGTSIEEEKKEIRREPEKVVLKELPIPDGIEFPKKERPRYIPDPSLNINGREDRIFKDGSRMVIERKITEAGRTNVYRRISHRWGGVFYFDNERPITVHQWEQLFGDR